MKRNAKYTEYGGTATLTTSVADAQQAFESSTDESKRLVVALGVGAFLESSPYSSFNCGDSLAEDAQGFMGQATYQQGALSGFWAVSARRGDFEGVTGNPSSSTGSSVAQGIVKQAPLLMPYGESHSAHACLCARCPCPCPCHARDGGGGVRVLACHEAVLPRAC